MKRGSIVENTGAVSRELSEWIFCKTRGENKGYLALFMLYYEIFGTDSS